MNTRVNDQAEGLGDDNARPDAAEQQPQAPATPEPPAPTDPDVIEAEAARAALAAEQSGQGGEQQQQQPDAGQQPPQQQAPAPGTPPAGPQQPRGRVVPYDRFVEVNRALASERERRAYLEGMVAAQQQQGGTAPAAPDQQQQQPQAQPADADPITAGIREQRAALRAAAERFDRGDMTLAEYEDLRGQAEDRITELNLQRVQQAQGGGGDSLADQAIENAHLNTLYSRFPYAAALNEQQATALAGLARQELALEGRPIRDGSKAETLRLREKVAELSNTWGPKWGLRPSSQQPATPGRQQPSTRPQAPALSPQAQARQQKMGLAAGLPPDPAQIGMGAPSDMSAEQIAVMDDEAIAALPAHVRHRVLASTA